MAILTGFMRLGRDAEIRKVGGDSVCNLALAYNHGKKADNLTQWVDASLWGKRAEALAQYLTKGTGVVVTLSDPAIRTYKKKDGSEGFTLAGNVIDLTFAGGGEKKETKPAPKPTTQDGPDDDIPF